MPLVRIDLRAGKPKEHIRAIGAAVHQALGECLEVPVRDYFQIITEHDEDHLIVDPSYLDIERSEDTVLIQVFLSVGRTTEKKQAFYAKIVELLQKNPGMRPQDVIIVLVQNTREDWSFGNGEAQYVVRPKEDWK